MLRVLDLFSGIGGFSLGLERTGGFETVAFCEIDPFCRRVLAKHWPNVRQYEDVRELTAKRLRADGIIPDVICGGFPCQDISTAGRQAGIEAARSGLWSELARVIGEVRPSFAIVENVTNLLSGPSERPGWWFGRVLGDLAALGFDAQWHCIPASAVGAPHIRDRVWIIAYPQHSDAHEPGLYRTGKHEQRNTEPADKQIRLAQSLGEILADAASKRPGEARQYCERSTQWATCRCKILGYADCARCSDVQGRCTSEELNGFRAACSAGLRDRASFGWWSEPDVGRVVTRLPSHVDPLRALGNAVVPQIPEIIGRAILKAIPLPMDSVRTK